MWVGGDVCVSGWVAGGCLDMDICTEWFHKQALAATERQPSITYMLQYCSKYCPSARSITSSSSLIHLRHPPQLMWLTPCEAKTENDEFPHYPHDLEELVKVECEVV